MSNTPRVAPPGWRTYLVVSGMLALLGGLLAFLVDAGDGRRIEPRALVAPMLAMTALTALVGLLMVVVRNVSVLRGAASVAYYRDYHSDAPDERIERPARVFNNLTQLPSLFYVVCILSMLTAPCDLAQRSVAWAFVALRVLHALVYLTVNHVPARFGAWVAASIALFVLWTRLALHYAG